ncbi:MAG: DUF3303 family protein [Bryobacterales bacterium]|nr:DUF3303 family protein [Bryobacterales bacterium]
MKFISTFSIRPGSHPSAAARFLKGDTAPPVGIKLLGRWHKCDLSGGVSLWESDDPAAMYAFALSWAEVLEMTTYPVVEDADAGAALAKQYGS